MERRTGHDDARRRPRIGEKKEGEIKDRRKRKKKGVREE
jgi:hypothetical protein